MLLRMVSYTVHGTTVTGVSLMTMWATEDGGRCSQPTPCVRLSPTVAGLNLCPHCQSD